MSSFGTKLICLKANEAFLDPSTGFKGENHVV